jgi:hypothetical protein
MANEATAELYTRQSGINKNKLKTDYEQYLADLATKYGISGDQLNSNLESRGILRSGEAGTARTRLSAAEEAARTAAKTTYDYNVATEDTSLATKLAGLMAGTPSTSPTPAPTPTPTTTPAPAPAVRPTSTPSTAVAYNGAGTTQGTLPQAVTLPPNFDMSGFMTPNKTKTKPVVYGGGTSQGQLPQLRLPTATTRPGRGAR